MIDRHNEAGSRLLKITATRAFYCDLFLKLVSPEDQSLVVATARLGCVDVRYPHMGNLPLRLRSHRKLASPFIPAARRVSIRSIL